MTPRSRHLHVPRPRWRLALLVALLAAGPASEAAAQAPGSFARIGFGARGIAMGGGLSADVFQQASPFYNPALSPLAGPQTVDAAAGFLSLDRELQHGQFTFRLPPRAGAAVGIIRAGVSGIDGRDASGYHTGELSTEESVVFATFGLAVSQRVSGGFGLRFYRSDLLEGVSAPVTLGLSMGLAARVSDRLAFGLAVDDLLARYSWDTAALGGASRTIDRFPVRVRFGSAYRLGEDRGLLTAEVEAQAIPAVVRRYVTREIGGQPQLSLSDERRTFGNALFRLGGEYWLAEPFALRLGIDRIGQDGLRGAAPAGGFALRHSLGEISGRVDYTIVLEPYGLGIMHMVALNLDL
jgi:hypothetical protein